MNLIYFGIGVGLTLALWPIVIPVLILMLIARNIKQPLESHDNNKPTTLPRRAGASRFCQLQNQLHLQRHASGLDNRSYQ